MKRALAVLTGLLCCSPAWADYTATQGAGTTFWAQTISAKQMPTFGIGDINGASIIYAPGSTTAGQSGFDILCRTLTAAPTDTTGQSNIPSCTTAGELRVNIGAAGTVAISGTVAVTQSGTWTVQPGNTANTTPWLFTLNQGGGSATTAPTAYGTAPGAGNVIGVNAFVTNANANGQNTMANSSPVVLSSNQSVADPCTFQAKKSAPFGTAGATNVQVVAPVGGQKVYVCSIAMVIGAATVVNVIEGTGAACTTANEFAIWGSTTATNGMSLPANGGFTQGSGNATVGVTSTASNGVCILMSTSVQFGGTVAYVQQ